MHGIDFKLLSCWFIVKTLLKFYFDFSSLILAGIGDLNDSTIKSGLELISTLIKMIIGDENIYNKNADRIKREIKVCVLNI